MVPSRTSDLLTAVGRASALAGLLLGRLQVRCDEPEDLSGLRVPSDLRLLEDRDAEDLDLEPSATGPNEVKIHMGILLADFGRQPGGLGLVVSDPAVVDSNVHETP